MYNLGLLSVLAEAPPGPRLASVTEAGNPAVVRAVTGLFEDKTLISQARNRPEPGRLIACFSCSASQPAAAILLSRAG